jgi:hypothetical protein
MRYARGRPGRRRRANTSANPTNQAAARGVDLEELSAILHEQPP